MFYCSIHILRHADTSIQMHLYIYAEDPTMRNYIQEQINTRRLTDSGFDIPMVNQSAVYEKLITFDFGITVAATSEHGSPEPLLLIPRSSIANSPFRLANSIGLIDMGYRGSLKAKVDVIQESGYLVIVNGTRYFQLCRKNWMPWKTITLVNNLNDLPPPPDSRGSGGFGSTGH